MIMVVAAQPCYLLSDGHDESYMNNTDVGSSTSAQLLIVART